MGDKNAPIGPLALTLRICGARGRTVTVVAALACTGLLIGVCLLLT
ncbi:hypothetical protein [Streptomyces sp. M92]|nr:hypothetical protein [Streptomyces sp. M92]WCN05305.1 hypothetical protein M6G08_26255 [Streptomyces sp. M92]